jgi:DNA-binding MarR family transcriptional regulator
VEVLTVSISALEALELWRRTIVNSVRDDSPDLTTRQMAILLTIYLLRPPHTVRGLAQSLNISKPAVTRAVDRLSLLDFVRRKTDETDKRNVLIQRTVRGSVFLRDYGDLVAGIADELAISGNPEGSSSLEKQASTGN